MIEESKTTITTQKRRVYTAEDLRKHLKLPRGAKLFVHVPGGGDWSSMDLEIGVETNLEVAWTKEKVKP